MAFITSRQESTYKTILTSLYSDIIQETTAKAQDLTYCLQIAELEQLIGD